MTFRRLTERFLGAFGVAKVSPEVSVVGVKFVPKGAEIPEGFCGDDIPTPWCGAVKVASEGDRVAITKENIGCPAGGIALGLVDEDDSEVLEGDRKYTSLMHRPASPKDFTDGHVYACKGSGHMEYALFGDRDTGRYGTLDAAKKAVSGMAGLNRAVMNAVLAFPPDGVAFDPDVVILGLQPKQALRAIQGFCYESGDRVDFTTIGIRGVCADVTAFPYLKRSLNASFFCLGARALAGWEGDRLALGLPYKQFEEMTVGMERSVGGFPYAAYP